MNKLFSDIQEPVAVFVRVFFGALWLHGASWKEVPRFGLDAHENLYYWVSRAVEFPVWGPYTAFVEHIVLPNFLPFAWAIFLTELAIGAALVLGIRVRFFSLLSLLMTINIALTVLNTPAEWPWSYALMGMVALYMAAHPWQETRWSLEYWFKRVRGAAQ